MRPRRYVRLLSATLLAALAVAGPAHAVTAADGSGWWNSANRGVPTPAPPDIPPNGLLVQGLSADPSSYQAIAAMRITVATDERIERLVLSVAGSSPSQPAVTACPTTGDWTPATNGAWADAPKFDCSSKVAGVFKAEGSQLIFEGIAQLTAGRTLSIALVPSGSTRVVFSAPTRDSVVVTRQGRTEPTAPTSPTASGADPSASFVPHPAAAAAGWTLPPTEMVPSPVSDSAGEESDFGLDKPLLSADARSSAISRASASGIRRPSERGEQLMTAILLFALLGTMVARMGRGGGRLRPATVPWASLAARVQSANGTRSG